MKICDIKDCNKKHYGKGLCNKHYKKFHYQNNKDLYKEKALIWSYKNKEKRKKIQGQYRDSNKEKIKSYFKKYIRENKKIRNLRNRIWKGKNKDKVLKWANEYQKKRKAIDIGYKLRLNLRSRLNKALKRNQKGGSAVKDLGCSVEQLKKYLEFKFQSGMIWENYGIYGWHIDHIIPLSSFDLTDREQFLKACHYTNLQPLWARDNWKKSNKKVG